MKKELKYRCKIFDVLEEEFVLPNGKQTRQNWVSHKPTVAIVAVNENKEFLLIKQYRNAVKQDLLEIPAGSMDREGESPQSCARRELAEETGFQARSFVKLFAGYLLPGYCDEYMYFFLARDLYPELLPPDSDEFIALVPTEISLARKLVENGEIFDAKTALGIILADKYLNGEKLLQQ